MLGATAGSAGALAAAVAARWSEAPRVTAPTASPSAARPPTPGPATSSSLPSPSALGARAAEPTLGARPWAADGRRDGCLILHQARRITPSVDGSVALFITPDAAPRHFWVGFAASAAEARGLRLDAETLSPSERLVRPGLSGLTGVVPSENGQFQVDRAEAGASLRALRSVPGGAGFALGVSPEGLVRRGADGALSVVWPGGGDAESTEPRAERLGEGFVVALRRGGQAGKLLVGHLDGEGRAVGALSEVTTDAALLGVPALASAGGRALLAFAAKRAASDRWGLQLALLGGAEASPRAVAFEPPGAAGGEQIAPAVTGLADGRWLLQWTEGAPGAFRVRVITLGATLEAPTDPVTVSAADVNAGQGTLCAHGADVLSLHLVKTEAAHSLWATTLRCL